MTAKQIKNIAASVRYHLLKLSKELVVDFNRILLLYTQEKFLYRLMKSKYKDNLILKGGVFFYGVFEQKARPTKDIDFLADKIKKDKTNFRNIVTDIISQDVEDGLIFDKSSLSIEEITEDAEYQGLRIKVKSYLEKAHIVLQLDFGFGDIVHPKPIPFEYPSLMAENTFQIYSYSWESVIAEKFEAIVKLSDLNSRMKDFYDLHFILLNQNFEGTSLQQAISKTFVNRGTDFQNYKYIFSNEFKKSEDKHKQWQAFLSKNRLESDNSFDNIIECIQTFVEPIVTAELNKKLFRKKWESKKQTWLDV